MIEKFEEGKCYCIFPQLNEYSNKCKLCGGKDPKQIEMKIRKEKKK
jgi:hypothetical protein